MRAAEIFDLAGQVAFVTGAGGGLGRVMAQTLAANGARVACFDTDSAGLTETLAQIEHAQDRALAICGDVAEAEAVDAAIDECVDRFGSLSIAVANAGISDRGGVPLHLADPEEWHAVVAVNLTGVYNTNRAALTRMVPQNAGKIVNVASMWGLAGAAGLFPRPAYSATKGGVVNLTRELALEYAAQGIQVNALCPGFFRTETRPRDAAHAKIMEAYTPMGRIADAGEIAGSLLYLVSSASDFVTGSTLVVDGGVLAR